MTNTDLRRLDIWCRQRRLHWFPARADGIGLAMSMVPDARSRLWQRMLLVQDGSGYHLHNELGDELATASDMPALLDAMDGGIDAPVVVAGHLLRQTG